MAEGFRLVKQIDKLMGIQIYHSTMGATTGTPATVTMHNISKAPEFVWATREISESDETTDTTDHMWALDKSISFTLATQSGHFKVKSVGAGKEFFAVAFF
jgi:hypothetical protein